MLIVFEVFMTKGGDPDDVLSAETLHETQAQVMTPEQAAAVGFQGVKVEPGELVRLVAVAPRDAQFVQRRLEANPHVDRFRVHEVDV